jgi:DNA-binding IclR family transcriptional regulator
LREAFNSVNSDHATAPALGRGLSILELLAESRRGLTLSAIARRLELPKSTTHQLLKCLATRGYVHCSERTRRYLFSLKLLRLSHMALHALKLREGHDAVLRSLMHETNLTVHLGILEDTEAILIGKLEPPEACRIATWPGRRMELHCTGIGKVLLAWLPEDRLRRLIETVGLPRHNENTIASTRKLKECLKEVRVRGYAVDDEEDELGFRCIAAPILDDHNGAIAAVSVVGTIGEITLERVAQLAGRVKAAAGAIAASLRAGAAEGER